MTDSVVAVRGPSVLDADFRAAVAAGVVAGLTNRDVAASLGMKEGTFNVRMTNLRADVEAKEGKEVADKLFLKRSPRTGGKGGRTATAKTSMASIFAKLGDAPAAEPTAEPAVEAPATESTEVVS